MDNDKSPRAEFEALCNDIDKAAPLYAWPLMLKLAEFVLTPQYRALIAAALPDDTTPLPADSDAARFDTLLDSLDIGVAAFRQDGTFGVLMDIAEFCMSHRAAIRAALSQSQPSVLAVGDTAVVLRGYEAWWRENFPRYYPDLPVPETSDIRDGQEVTIQHPIEYMPPDDLWVEAGPGLHNAIPARFLRKVQR